MNDQCTSLTLFQQLDALLVTSETINDFFEIKAFEALRQTAEDAIQLAQVAEECYLGHLRVALQAAQSNSTVIEIMDDYFRDNIEVFRLQKCMAILKNKEKTNAADIILAVELAASKGTSFAVASEDLQKILQNIPTREIQQQAIEVHRLASAAADAAEKADQFQSAALATLREQQVVRESINAKRSSSLAKLQSLELIMATKCKTAFEFYRDFLVCVDVFSVAVDKMGDTNVRVAMANEMRRAVARTPQQEKQAVEATEKAHRVQEAKAAEACRVQEAKAAEACRVQAEEAAAEARRVQEAEAAEEARRVQEAEAAEEARRVQAEEAAAEARRVQEAEVAEEARRVQEAEAAEAHRIQEAETAEAHRIQEAETAEEARRIQEEELRKARNKADAFAELRHAELMCKTALVIFSSESPSDTETIKESIIRIMQQMTPAQIQAADSLSRLATDLLSRKKPVISPKRGDTPVVPLNGRCAYCNADEAGGSQRYQRWSNVIVGDKVFVCCRACYLSTVPAHKGSVAVGPDGKLEIFCQSGKPRSRNQKRAKEHCVGYKEKKIYFAPADHDDALSDWHQSKQAKKQKYTV